MKDTKGTYFILALLLVLAAVLRLIHPLAMPFSCDELSAIIRTHYSTISDEIRNGVMLKDTHPAGVQVFLYYWTKLFGYTEIIVKLPFIICGILSVYYVFRLGREWFNSTVGLVCAAYMATIQYTIMFSQLARPYSSGLFFSLMMVWYWNKVVFLKKANGYYKHLFLYVLFSALCAYNHHFSLLFAAVVGLTGVFFMRGKRLLKYALAGIAIFILYIPHLHIFFYQLKEGGIGNWLGKPQNDFILQYSAYILQFSILAYIIAGLLFLIGLINLLRKRSISTPYYFISLAWFLVPFLIGFFYSKYDNAVLQYSVLIFSFPFLLYSVFGLLPNLNVKARMVIITAICCVNIFVLVNDRKYYEIFYQSHWERQVVINDSVYKKEGKDMTALAQSTPDSITAFYFRKYNTYIPYAWLPDSSSKLPLIAYLEQHKTPYLTYDYMAGSDLLYMPVILNYYPYVAFKNHLQGGTNYIFTSLPDKGKSPYIFQSVSDFVTPCEYWGETDKSFLSDTILYAGKHACKMDSLHEWAPAAFSCDLDKMTTNRNDIILISLSLYPLGSLKDVVIVTSFDSHGKGVFWSATPVSDFIPDTLRGKWVKAYHAINLSDSYPDYPDIKVKVYIWNKGKRNFYMNDFGVRTIEGNPLIYWLIEKT